MALVETIPRLLKRPERSFFLFGPRGGIEVGTKRCGLLRIRVG